ncbi:SAV_6107 family HEPN domain-containing protein [Streptomyces sp. NBC_01408]|uniref:SAV_6107 family HEPN domain-containing protein n=1 Tax=Streptomyces sp. NBC_01408 TaxID=2903855 RepID=UPI0022540D15|nr:SAV_6107 family HEPN domain-containing protein [Streptomyces sp. NBC_01408]MCX4693787.1 SAV_6107 family HEPN domain-containing protein [Streptomyces sp. NBC_01408]
MATPSPSPVHSVLRRSAAPSPTPPPRGVPTAALDLLAKARAGLAEAAGLTRPGERYATAHLAALRAAAAVLAARGRPEPIRGPRRRPRIRSTWELLPELAPELAEWSALFASGAARRARAEAGIADAASGRDADDLMRAVAMFVRLVERMLALQAPAQSTLPAAPQSLPQPRPERPDAG